MQTRFLKIAVAVVFVSVSATTLAAATRTDKAPARSVSALTLDPAQRASVAANAAPRPITRRAKTAQPATNGAAALRVDQLRRALNGPAKSRGRGNGASALVSTAQQRSLQLLNDQTQDNGGVDAHFDARNGTLAFLKPQGKALSVNTRALLPGVLNAATAAQQFLADHRALLKLDDPQLETRVTQQLADSSGRTHVRLQQTFQGVPLFGKELLVHLEGLNGVYLVQGSSEPTPRGLTTTPGITADAASATVRADLNAANDAPVSTELTIYTPATGAPILAYKVDIAPALDSRWIYFVDAARGGIVHRIRNLHDAPVTASGTDVHGTSRSFAAWQEGTGNAFYLIDPTRPTADAPYNPVGGGPKPSGDTFVLRSNVDGSQLSYVTSTTLNGGWDAAAVSAADNTRKVFDYYTNTHNRNSLDGNGKNLMVAVHFGDKLNNAFWNGTFMVYGDGDNQLFKPLAGCLDVAAHEMTHGVIENSANLVYENQSGALNESFADIFGAMVDRDDWTMGEDCTIPAPGYLRNLQNPAQAVSSQPTKMSQYQNLPNTAQGDNGGVHVNSGIPNRAAYLIAEGLSTEGLGTSIGREKTEQIFYKALTTYLTASSQFVDARRATIQAATDLYGAGSADVQAVTKAWDVVEVMDSGGSGGSTKPTPTDPVSGDDMMVYLYPEDDTFNDVAEPFIPSVQVMDRPFTGYDSNKDYSLPYVVAASYTRPAVATVESSTVILYVGVDNNIHATSLGGAAVQVTDSGDIFSIAISPDLRYLAYTRTAAADNNIYVVDLSDDSVATIPVVPVDYQQGATGADTIFFADSLAFDYTGRVIAFDALNCITTVTTPPADGDCSQGGGYQYWSVGFIDLSNGQLSFPFANQNPAIDLGYPMFASNNNFVIALDLQDWTDPTAIASKVVSVNLEEQTLQTVYDFGAGADPVWGVPSFWGDDAFVTFQHPDNTVASAASRVAVTAGWAGSGAAQLLNNFTVVMPVMHRAGTRQLTGALTASASLLDFGAVAGGESKSLVLTLSNNGNSDVNILSTSVDNAAFKSNAVNTRVPRGQSVSFNLTFTPGGTSGTQTGTLTINSDGNPATVTVSLTGATPTETPPAATKKKSKGGGDLNATTVFLMALVLLVSHGVRKRRHEA
jgi:Zn-dependent metalloprotease